MKDLDSDWLPFPLSNIPDEVESVVDKMPPKPDLVCVHLETSGDLPGGCCETIGASIRPKSISEEEFQQVMYVFQRLKRWRDEGAQLGAFRTQK